MCYYQIQTDNSTFDLVNYNYTIGLWINTYDGVKVSYMNGTSVLNAANWMEVSDITREQQFSPLNGNIVFIVVKGFSIAPTFNVTATLIIRRITPNPVATSNNAIVNKVIIKNITNNTQ
jgi:hypothetical protein